MGKIISFVNQKGGVGKTTSSINLAASLGLLGKKTLLVDLDPQGNSTTGVGINKGELAGSVYEVLTDRADIKNIVVNTKFKNLYLLPASINLAGVDMELMEMSRLNPEFIPQKQLEKHMSTIKNYFDYIILDCPPSLGLITTNALAASNSVIIPVQCEFFALEGIMQLLNSIMIAQKKLNPSLDIEGVLLTMLDNRTNLGLEVVEEIKSYFKEKVYDTIIPKGTKAVESTMAGQSLFSYDKESKPAIAYEKLCKEVLKIEKQRTKNGINER